MELTEFILGVLLKKHLKVEDLNVAKTFDFSLIIHRTYTLSSFLTTDISGGYLNEIQSDFDLLRNNGFTAILLFQYSATPTAPFKDAPSIEQLISHIQQLKVLFQGYPDVIYAVKFGFIGVWGEGTYLYRE